VAVLSEWKARRARGQSLNFILRQVKYEKEKENPGG
jgi:hypothetical protein